MPNRKQFTQKMENFCQYYVKDPECKGDASKSYRKAYTPKKASNETIWKAAATVLKKPLVASRIKELNEELVEKLDYCVEQALEEYEQARMLALGTENPSAMVSAVNGKCKLFGLGEEVVKHKGKVEIDGLTSLLDELNGRLDDGDE